jgi:hypothetical protein
MGCLLGWKCYAVLPPETFSDSHLKPLDASEIVFRLPKCNPLLEKELSPIQIASFFELTSDDKEQKPPRCSLWAEQKTSVLQAFAFQNTQSCPRWIVRFPVELISAAEWPFSASIRPEIVWDEDVEKLKPGWEGHAGILNLQQGGDSKDDKAKRRAIRTWIADLLNTKQPFSIHPDPN